MLTFFLLALLASFASAYYSPVLNNFVVPNNYTCLYSATNEFTCFANGQSMQFDGPEPYHDVGSASWWLHILFAIFLIAISGLMAVLIRSYLSQDAMALRVQMTGGSAEEQKLTAQIYPLVSKHYLLLATLLIVPCIANEWLPVFLSELFPDWLSILISTITIFLFNSILPQGLGKKVRLTLGYYFSWLTYALIGIFFVVAFPISKMFEFLVGQEEQTYFRRSELKELFNQHGENDGTQSINNFPLSEVEMRIIRGALNLREKKCNSDQIYTPLDKVFKLPLTAVINQETREMIVREGHSRIPVYLKQPHNMIGLALTKTLLALDPALNTPLANVDLCQVGKVTSDTPLYTLLNQFTNAKQGKNPNQTMKNKSIYMKEKGEKQKYNRSHMAIVLDAKDNLTVLGVVTLEDVIEELLEAEVWDEKDIPNIPHRPELSDVLQTPQAVKPISTSYPGASAKKPVVDEKVPLTTSLTSTTPYKFYGATDNS